MCCRDAAMIIVMASALHPALLAQGATARMRTEAEGVDLNQGVSLAPSSIQEALAGILRSAGRPGGMVVRSGCGDPAQSPLLVGSGSSLAGALDLMTSVHPAYYWTIREGVVNILPKRDPPPVMDVRIERFEWDTTAAVYLAVSNLSQSDSVRRRLAALGAAEALQQGPGLQPVPRIVNGVAEPRPPGRRYRVEGVTLLSALNAVVASYPNAIWYYEEWHCAGRRTYSFFARGD